MPGKLIKTEFVEQLNGEDLLGFIPKNNLISEIEVKQEKIDDYYQTEINIDLPSEVKQEIDKSFPSRKYKNPYAIIQKSQGDTIIKVKQESDPAPVRKSERIKTRKERQIKLKKPIISECISPTKSPRVVITRLSPARARSRVRVKIEQISPSKKHPVVVLRDFKEDKNILRDTMNKKTFDKNQKKILKRNPKGNGKNKNHKDSSNKDKKRSRAKKQTKHNFQIPTVPVPDTKKRQRRSNKSKPVPAKRIVPTIPENYRHDYGIIDYIDELDNFTEKFYDNEHKATFYGTISGKRTLQGGKTQIMVSWFPSDIFPPEWMDLTEELKKTARIMKKLSIFELNIDQRQNLAAFLLSKKPPKNSFIKERSMDSGILVSVENSTNNNQESDKLSISTNQSNDDSLDMKELKDELKHISGTSNSSYSNYSMDRNSNICQLDMKLVAKESFEKNNVTKRKPIEFMKGNAPKKYKISESLSR